MSLFTMTRGDITKQEIIDIFEYKNIGKVKNIDFITTINEKGYKCYNTFIHFHEWYHNQYTNSIQQEIFNNKSRVNHLRGYKFYYNDKIFWKLLENKTMKNMTLVLFNADLNISLSKITEIFENKQIGIIKDIVIKDQTIIVYFEKWYNSELSNNIQKEIVKKSLFKFKKNQDIDDLNISNWIIIKHISIPNINLYFKNIDENITKEYIYKLFQFKQIGIVKSIEIINKNMLVKFDEWYDNKYTSIIQQEIEYYEYCGYEPVNSYYNTIFDMSLDDDIINDFHDYHYEISDDDFLESEIIAYHNMLNVK